MSEEEQRIRKAAGRTGGYSRSVLAGDLRVVIAELDALRLRTAGGEASQGEGDDSYMTPAQLRDHIQDLLRQRCAEVTEAMRAETTHLKYERQEIIDNALKEQTTLVDENRRLREALKAMEASRDQWANIAVQRGLELEDRAALAAEPASAESVVAPVARR